QLGIRDCGTTYYIWVKWTGGSNVKAGEAPYRYTYGSNVVVPKFKITQVTSLGTNEVTLKSEDIATAKSSNGLPFKYDFSTSTGTYTAQSQALFNATSTTPSINFNGAAYSSSAVSYQYLISDKSSDVAASTSGWVDTIASATASAVKSAYYLWVKVIINDKNVNLATTINTNKTAKIVAASSFVHSNLQPQKKTDRLVANGSPVDLIIPSTQISPAVEYSLNGTTFSAYGDAVRPTTAGTYKIYFRGAATSDGSFVAESKPSTGYPYYELTIYPQDATATAPKSNDVVYNGASRTASELITKGFAVIGEENRELEYAWNTNANYVSFDNLASQKDAGEYTLWYRYVAASENESAVSPSSITVKIQRAAITMQACTWTKEHEYDYNAADHTFLEAALDYTINGTSIKYSTGAGSQTMGKIYYALTSSNTEAPAIEEDCWTPNFADLKARKVGSYYIWVRVDDSGKNHKGIDPVCYNANYAIKINLASEQKYDQSTVTVIENLRFNAEGQALISGFTLKVSVPNSAETNQYKEVPNEDYAYTAFYYLSDDASVYPSIEGDLIENGWSTDYKTLKQTNADTYYLIVYLKVTDGSSIKSEVVAFTNYAAILAPAKHSDIKLSGITATPKEFSGDEQAIVAGELIATIPTTNKVITDKEITDIKYCFVGEDELEPKSTSTWYGSLADAKEKKVGKYQLFVWLKTTTNIDQTTDYIVPVLGDSLTEITRIDGLKLNIVELGIAKEDDLVYTGEEVRLITSAPKLQMGNGTDLEGKLGTVKYYISGDRDEFTTEGTTKEDRAYNLSEVTELNAGTYYIWVAFEQGENHTSIDRKYVAKVTITPATGDNIALSGININQALTYNGQNQDLITSEVVQKISGNTLDAVNIESVEYGYSNNPENQPTSYVSEIADLEARDADKYYVWIKVITKSNSVTNQKNITDYVKLYSEEEFAQIFKATLSLSNIGISENEGLVYIGQAQSLATFIDGKTTITLNNNGINLNTDELNPDLVCEWGLGKDTTTEPTTWVVDINELEGTNAGDYYLWVRVEKESKNFNAFKAKHFKTINIGQADICLEKDLIVKTGLKYTGTAQSLVESAPIIKFRAANGDYIEATGLVVKYAILAEEILTGDIEEIKATDAKEYEIYYYVEADAENNNWELTEFTAEVEIAKVAADIEGIGLSATPEAKEKLTYNGTSQDLITY
ncbi:MAG: hypothetical protein IKT33_02180, partial [Clostridia bacterium]|nr:hypothetical protein [Clostridia bacterium]